MTGAQRRERLRRIENELAGGSRADRSTAGEQADDFVSSLLGERASGLRSAPEGRLAEIDAALERAGLEEPVGLRALLIYPSLTNEAARALLAREYSVRGHAVPGELVDLFGDAA